ncbi:MAG: hypothetical protein ACRYF2_00300 [Janthinobacterium lividum]
MPTVPTLLVTGPATLSPGGRLLADSGSLDAAPGDVELTPIGLAPVAVLPEKPAHPASMADANDAITIVLTFMVQTSNESA